MDVELKQYLDGKFAEINGEISKVDGKFAHIDSKFAEINGRISKLEIVVAQLDSKFSELDGKFATKQDLERVETALLTEFHKWASPLDARIRTHMAAIRAIDLEYEGLNERVQKLENPGQ